MPPLRSIPLKSLSPYRYAPRFYSISTQKPITTEPTIITTDLPASHTGRIRILSLNRPNERNAISTNLLHELRTAIDIIAAEHDPKVTAPHPSWYQSKDSIGLAPTRAVIIASNCDESFCAGADLRERAGFSADQTATFLSNLRSAFTALSSLPIPTISAVASMALGGGLELALCTHLRVLASTATVSLPETRLAILPGAGGTYRLPGLIGVNRARDLILTGRRVAASEAYFLGIANRLVEVLPDGEEKERAGKAGLLTKARELVLKEAVKLAEDICKGGPVSVQSALEALKSPSEEVENKCYEKVVRTKDRDEGLLAFREKRIPVYKGW